MNLFMLGFVQKRLQTKRNQLGLRGLNNLVHSTRYQLTEHQESISLGLSMLVALQIAMQTIVLLIDLGYCKTKLLYLLWGYSVNPVLVSLFTI